MHTHGTRVDRQAIRSVFLLTTTMCFHHTRKEDDLLLLSHLILSFQLLLQHDAGGQASGKDLSPWQVRISHALEVTGSCALTQRISAPVSSVTFNLIW